MPSLILLAVISYTMETTEILYCNLNLQVTFVRKYNYAFKFIIKHCYPTAN